MPALRHLTVFVVSFQMITSTLWLLYHTGVYSPEEAMTHLQNILISLGANIIQADNKYISTTFTSNVLKFVDDVEFRIDVSKNLIHIRSASRLGKSDFGANNKRVDSIRQKWEQLNKI